MCAIDGFSTSIVGPDETRDSSEQAASNIQMLENVDNLLLLQSNSAGHEDFALSIPPDQVQTIQNINSLITEVVDHFCSWVFLWQKYCQ